MNRQLLGCCAIASVVALLGCTRGNPGFGVGDEAGTGEQEGEIDPTGASASASATTSSASAGTGSGGSGGDSMGTGAGSGGVAVDCEPQLVAMSTQISEIDTFFRTAEGDCFVDGQMVQSDGCRNLNFGTSIQGPVIDGVTERSIYAVRFHLPDFTIIESASLQLTFEGPPVLGSNVEVWGFDRTWVEGLGDGRISDSGDSDWNFAALPNSPWPNGGPPAAFAGSIGAVPGEGNNIVTIPIDAAAVQDWIDGSNFGLAVTLQTDGEPAQVMTREAPGEGDRPLLHVFGC